MQTTHGLLLLKLIDLGAAVAGVDDNDDYNGFRKKVGEFIIENRVPSKPEFDKLTSDADALIGQFSSRDVAIALYEDPATHMAPAGLKSDVLRTGGGAGPNALNDPAAIENTLRDGTDDQQALDRAESHKKEAGVAYADGQNATTPTDQSRPGASGQAAAFIEGDTPVVKNDEPSTEGDDNADDQPDFEGTTKKDLQDWLTEQNVEFESDANKPRLVELAKAKWDELQAAKSNDGTGDEGEKTGE